MDLVDSFEIAYYSEVHAIINIYVDGGEVVATATHVRDGIGIEDWFHFCDKEVTVEELVTRGDTGLEALSKLSHELYPGAKMLLEKSDDVDNPKEQFFTDVMIAAMKGTHYPPYNGHPRAWKNESGRKLYEASE